LMPVGLAGTATNKGIGFEGTEKGKTAGTMVHISRRQYSTTRLTKLLSVVLYQELSRVLATKVEFPVSLRAKTGRCILIKYQR